MIAVGAVFVSLYGMVAFGVVTTLNHRPETEIVVASHKSTDVAPIGPEALKPADDPTKRADATPQKPDPEKKDSGAKAKDAMEGKLADDKAKGAEQKAGTNPVAGAEPAKPVPPSPSMPSGKELARVVTPQPALVPKAEGPKTESWGMLSGSPGDCTLQVDATGMSANVPGTLHVISPELKRYNSPRLLVDAGGDFTAVVKVLGRISPGTVALDFPIPPGEKPKDMPEAPKFPFTFQGAGLLVWQDENNFVKLERAARFDGLKRVPIVLLEQYQNGQAVNGKMIPAKDRETAQPPAKDKDIDLTLRIVRLGSELRCTYSPDDGKSWLEVKRLQAPKLAPVVKVGVSASNVSAKPFTPRFQGFDLTK